jgi:hypothetical protein
MTNRSAKEIQAKTIRVLAGMLRMLDAADPINQANTTGNICVRCVLRYITSMLMTSCAFS